MNDERDERKAAAQLTDEDRAVKDRLMELFDDYYLELDAKHVKPKGQDYLQVAAALMVQAHVLELPGE